MPAAQPGSAAFLADSLEEVREKEARLKNLPTVENVESIAAMVPENQKGKRRVCKRKPGIPC